MPRSLKNLYLRSLLNLMVERLRELQQCISCDFHSNQLVKISLLIAWAGVEACNIARQKVPPKVMGLLQVSDV